MKYLKIAGACALFGLSFSAFAGGGGCPAAPDAWDTTNEANGGTFAVVAGGAANTNCRLDVQQGPNNNGIATVRDDMAAAESRYRARFYVDVRDLANGSTSGAHRFKAFVAGNPDNPYTGTDDVRARPALMQMFIVGQAGNAARLGGFCRNVTAAAGDGDRARFGDGANPGTVDLLSGPNGPTDPMVWNVVEVEIVVGAGTGACRIWVNNDVENTPNWEITGIDNSAMVGVTRANLGSTGATQAYADLLGTATTSFDEFESRRQTFIGSLAP